MRDTHIFLRKQAGAVLLLVLTLSFVSCQSSEENTYLEYGQVKWGMMTGRGFGASGGFLGEYCDRRMWRKMWSIIFWKT